MNTLEIKAFFDDKADSYTQKPDRENARLEIVKLANIKEDNVIIDLAGGKGVMTKLMLNYNPKKIILNDLSTGMINCAKKEIRDDRVKFIESDFFDVNFEEVDLIMLFNAYPHFKDKKSLAKHAAIQLKTGGKLIICHDSSKDIINAIHKDDSNNDSFSKILKSPNEVYQDFSNYFQKSSEIDSDIFYLEMLKK